MFAPGSQQSLPERSTERSDVLQVEGTSVDEIDADSTAVKEELPGNVYNIIGAEQAFAAVQELLG